MDQHVAKHGVGDVLIVVRSKNGQDFWLVEEAQVGKVARQWVMGRAAVFQTRKLKTTSRDSTIQKENRFKK
jgi:hypothetical protein